MNKFRISSVFLIGALLLAGCDAGPQKPDPAQAPLAGATIGGPFSLTDQKGAPVTDEAFKGKYRMMYFGYTYCPDVCPVDVQVLSQGLSTFEKSDPARANRVAPVFISVDPKRDTPAALKSFLDNFHPRFIGLTGTEAQIADIAKAFGVYFEREKPNAQGGYLVNHSNAPMLFDPDGKPLALIPHDKGAKAVAEELDRWVR